MGTGNILETIQFYLSYPFVWYALITGTLIALCSSLLGVTLVLKRFSYIGDGLSHVAFGAMAAALMLLLRGPFISLYNVPEATKVLTSQVMASAAFIIFFQSHSFIGLMGILRGGGSGCAWPCCVAACSACPEAWAFRPSGRALASLKHFQALCHTVLPIVFPGARPGSAQRTWPQKRQQCFLPENET